MDKPIERDEALEQKLTPEQVEVMRQCGTEAPGSGKWLHNKDTGMYVCAACGAELFSSDAKFDSGTGWPSFDEAANRANVELLEDKSLGMTRTEVRCKRCGSHLGHLFHDGPTESGQRFCINSVALDFKKQA